MLLDVSSLESICLSLRHFFKNVFAMLMWLPILNLHKNFTTLL